MTGCPDKRLLIGAMLDGELDAIHALELESHLDTCAGCQEALANLQAVRAAMSMDDLRSPAPASFQQRVRAALAAEERALARTRPRAAAAWFGGGAMTAIAASLALFTVLSPPAPALTRELVQSHVRSLQAQHLVDVPTSDRHTVKPWFNGKIDFAPPVADLVADGFPLVGGRLDDIQDRTVAALVYRRRAHVINLFIWPGSAPGRPVLERREGYSLVRWSRGGLVFWAVSDVDAGDLEAFQRAYVLRTAS